MDWKKRLGRKSTSVSTTSSTEVQTQKAEAAIDAVMAASVTATANEFVSRVYSANIFSDLYVIQEARGRHVHSPSPRLRKSRHLTYKEDVRNTNYRNDSWNSTNYSHTQKCLLSPTIARDCKSAALTHEGARQPHRASTDTSVEVTRQSCQTQAWCRPSFEEVKMMDLSGRRPPTKSKLHKVSSRAA